MAKQSRLEALRLFIAKRSDGDGILNIAATLTGLFTGLVSVALLKLIELIQELSYGTNPDIWHIMLIPTVGGLIVGALLKIFPGSSGPGMADTVNAVAHNSRLPFRSIIGKTLATGFALGMGASGGREGPTVQIGATIGQVISRFAAMDINITRTMMAAGAAAGISAAFNAPIAGMIFAMEVIVGGFAIRSLEAVVVASVSASVVSRVFLGSPVALKVHGEYLLNSPVELFAYVILGIFSTLVARSLMISIFYSDKIIHVNELPLIAKTTIGGCIIGFFSLGMPEVIGMGTNLPALNNLSPTIGISPVITFISGQADTTLVGLGILIVLIIAKIIATGVSINLGFPVGVMAPCLFLGAALGNVTAHLGSLIFGENTLNAGSFAVVGTAAVLGAATKFPLSSILLIFELTSAYNLIIPMMLTTGVSVLLADKLWDHSVFTWELYSKGARNVTHETTDVLQTVLIEEIMVDKPVTVSSSTSIQELMELSRETDFGGFPVVDNGHLVGIVTTSDVYKHRQLINKMGDDVATVANIYTKQITTVLKTDFAWSAMRKMGMLNIGLLPVVSSIDHNELLGLVTRGDLVRAYRRGIVRSMGKQQMREESKLRRLTARNLNETMVGPSSQVEGMTVAEITLPPETILISILRNDEVLMPKGDTFLQAGDIVTFVAHPDHAVSVEKMFIEPVNEGKASNLEGVDSDDEDN